MDARNYQTSTVAPAEPGVFPYLMKHEVSGSPKRGGPNGAVRHRLCLNQAHANETKGPSQKLGRAFLQQQLKLKYASRRAAIRR